MTPGQLRARLSRSGLSDREMADAYGMNIRALRRMKAGKALIPRDMEQWFDEYEKARG